MVPDDQLPRANMLMAVGDQLPLLLGAALVGPALALLGVGTALVVPAALLALVAVLAPRLPVTHGRELPVDRGSTEKRSLWRLPVAVHALVGLSIVYYTAYGPFETVFPLFARDDLGSGAGGFGLVWATFGAGALATVGLAARLSRRHPGVWNAVGAIAWGLVTMPILVVSGTLPAAVVFLLSGAVWGPYSAIETTALHRLAPSSVHGRLFGTQRALLQSAAPAGAAIGIVATTAWSPGTVLFASMLGCTLAGCLALMVPGIRRPVTAGERVA
jgi:hypothetical protein